jgi:hypothetical protein
MMNFPATNAHPWFAHFHDDNYNPNQFKLAGGFPESGKVLLLTGGPIDGNGGKWTPTGLGIHERIFGDTFPRKFELIESPLTPEPTSLILMGLGVALTLGYARLRRKSAVS